MQLQRTSAFALPHEADIVSTATRWATRKKAALLGDLDVRQIDR